MSRVHAPSSLLAVLLSLFAMHAVAAHAGLPLVLERTIPLNNAAGRIDHMAIDVKRGRLFVAELGNGTVDVVDVARGMVVRRLEGFREPQGIGYAPEADVIAVASAGDGTVRLVRGSDYSAVATIRLGDDADDMRLNPENGELVVGYGEGGLAMLDPAKASVVGRIGLSGHPEGFQIDAAKRRAFVNVPDARQIAVLDLVAGKQTATWRVPDLGGNYPMALGDGGGTIIAAFRRPPKLVFLDAADGRVLAGFDTCADADDVFADAKRQRFYVSCGEGVVDAFVRGPAGYRRLGRVETKRGARTSLFVPELDRLFVAARAGLFGFRSDAAILVFRPSS